MKGKPAAIQPIVPHNRTRPNWALSVMCVKAIELATEMVGT